MTEILYLVIEYITKIHSYIMKLNDAYEYNFTDKELHFLVIGVVGMLLVFVIHPLFLLLAKHKHVMVITWIYVFTLILMFTFAIEIGQKITQTGVMEFEDILFGISGFFVMFAIFAVVREVFHLIRYLIRSIIKRSSRK